MIFHRDQYLRPRGRNYTERELKAMAEELRRIAPASRVASLFKRKGERPMMHVRIFWMDTDGGEPGDGAYYWVETDGENGPPVGEPHGPHSSEIVAAREAREAVIKRATQ